LQKIVIHSPGGYEKLKLEEFPDPVPGVSEVVVKTEAVGVNYADCAVRWGVYESAKKYVGWPITRVSSSRVSSLRQARVQNTPSATGFLASAFSALMRRMCVYPRIRYIHCRRG
jgi:hypothetical protein